MATVREGDVTRLAGAALVGLALWAGVSAGEAIGQDATAGASRGWRVGYAQADITPAPRQCQMAGFGRERYAKGAVAPLLSQVVALRDGRGRTGVLITADVIGFDRVMVEAMQRRIAKKHSLPAECVLIACSHTHWGPAAKLGAHFSCGAPNVWYLRRLEEAILANVGKALADLSPAKIEYGAIDFRQIACSRRRIKDGEVHWAPNREGSFDGHTPIIRIERDGSPRQLVIVGHASHPTSSGQIDKWSPDYPGAMRDRLVEALPKTAALFVQGCGGDAKIVHTDPKTGKLAFSAHPDRSKAAGRKLADAVLTYLRTGRLAPLGASLACSLATGQLSYGKRWGVAEIERQAYTGSTRHWQTWNARQFLALPDRSESFRYDAQVWKLGDRLTIFGMEGEVCSPWGPKLRKTARTEHAMVVGYANSTTVYIPDARMMKEGGYEVEAAQKYFRPAPFTQNIEREVNAIVAQALSAAE